MTAGTQTAEVRLKARREDNEEQARSPNPTPQATRGGKRLSDDHKNSKRGDERQLLNRHADVRDDDRRDGERGDDDKFAIADERAAHCPQREREKGKRKVFWKTAAHMRRVKNVRAVSVGNGANDSAQTSEVCETSEVFEFSSPQTSRASKNAPTPDNTSAKI